MSKDLVTPPRHGVQAKRWRDQLGTPGLRLPVCMDCGHTSYPLRERCPACLSDRLDWRDVDPAGRVLAVASIVHSNSRLFADRLPVAVCTVHLAAGPVVIAFAAGDLRIGQEVRVEANPDAQGEVILLAAAP